MNELEQQVKDKLTKVCICRAISQEMIKNSIREGMTTVEEISQATGATTGACHGGRCKGKIEELIESYKNEEWR